MYHPYPASLLSTLVYYLCNPRLLSAFPITPDDHPDGLYPSNPSPTINQITTTTNLTALDKIHCFLGRQRPRIHPVPTDCMVAIRGGIFQPHPPMDVHKFYDWSYQRGTADFILPHDGSWRHKTCAVAVRNQDKNLVGSFSLDEVGITAADITSDCVGDEDGAPPRQGKDKDKGGWSEVGVKGKMFYAVVYGVPYSPEDGNGSGNATAQVDSTIQRVPIPGDRQVDVTR